MIIRQSFNPVWVHGRAKSGPNSTEPNLFHHGKTTYRVGLLSEYATVMLEKKNVWGKGEREATSFSTDSRIDEHTFLCLPISEKRLDTA